MGWSRAWVLTPVLSASHCELACQVRGVRSEHPNRFLRWAHGIGTLISRR